MTGKPQVHGNLNLVEKYYGIPKEKIVSFCENTNPLGLSPLLKKSIIENVDALAKYPDSEYTDLRKSISEYCGVPMEQVIVGGGVTELTSRFVHETGAKKVMLMIPTYFQYAREIKLGGGEVVTYQLPEEDGFEVNLDDFLPMLDESFDLLILCNPNNPTGTVIKRDEMRRIVSRCAELGIYVMVDEVYVDFVDDSIDVTASPLTSEFDNLIVLRGVS